MVGATLVFSGGRSPSGQIIRPQNVTLYGDWKTQAQQLRSQGYGDYYASQTFSGDNPARSQGGTIIAKTGVVNTSEGVRSTLPSYTLTKITPSNTTEQSFRNQGTNINVGAIESIMKGSVSSAKGFEAVKGKTTDILTKPSTPTQQVIVGYSNYKPVIKNVPIQYGASTLTQPVTSTPTSPVTSSQVLRSDIQEFISPTNPSGASGLYSDLPSIISRVFTYAGTEVGKKYIGEKGMTIDLTPNKIPPIQSQKGLTSMGMLGEENTGLMRDTRIPTPQSFTIKPEMFGEATNIASYFVPYLGQTRFFIDVAGAGTKVATGQPTTFGEKATLVGGLGYSIYKLGEPSYNLFISTKVRPVLESKEPSTILGYLGEVIEQPPQREGNIFFVNYKVKVSSGKEVYERSIFGDIGIPEYQPKPSEVLSVGRLKVYGKVEGGIEPSTSPLAISLVTSKSKQVATTEGDLFFSKSIINTKVPTGEKTTSTALGISMEGVKHKLGFDIISGVTKEGRPVEYFTGVGISKTLKKPIEESGGIFFNKPMTPVTEDILFSNLPMYPKKVLKVVEENKIVSLGYTKLKRYVEPKEDMIKNVIDLRISPTKPKKSESIFGNVFERDLSRPEPLILTPEQKETLRRMYGKDKGIFGNILPLDVPTKNPTPPLILTPEQKETLRRIYKPTPILSEGEIKRIVEPTIPKNVFEVKPVKVKSTMVTGGLRTTKTFYEPLNYQYQESGGLFPVSVKPNILIQPTKQEIRQGQKNVPKLDLLGTQKQGQKQEQKGIGIQSTKQQQEQEQKQKQKEIQLLKQVQVQQQKEVQKLKSPSLTKLAIPTPFPHITIPPHTPIITIPTPTKSKIKSLLGKVSTSKGYQTYVKRFGKYQPLGKITTKGKAIKLGVMETKKTLSATFKITPTRREVTELDLLTYEPPSKEFRGYRVIKGVKIPLEETWIQKAPFRLSSGTERKEIQQARKSNIFKKRGGFKW